MCIAIGWDLGVLVSKLLTTAMFGPPAGLVVGYPERLGGGDVPRRPDGAPVHGQ